MNQLSTTIFEIRRTAVPFLDRLAGTFREMDRAYATIADRYGFLCHGCADNCCLTRFYHHTLLEYLYLSEGMRQLESRTRQTVVDNAMRVLEKMEAGDRRNQPVRTMCPLNHEGRCLTYAYRPMICRLHGIPHELHRADGRMVRSPGCDEFLNQCRQGGKTEYIPFDRTPHYRKMALLENELRLKTGAAPKLKLTIAQMIAKITDSPHEID